MYVHEWMCDIDFVRSLDIAEPSNLPLRSMWDAYVVCMYEEEQ
jgi:hypothetical protein